MQGTFPCRYSTCSWTELCRECFSQIRNNGKCRGADYYIPRADGTRTDQLASSVIRVSALQVQCPLQGRPSSEPFTLTQLFPLSVSLAIPPLYNLACPANGSEEHSLGRAPHRTCLPIWNRLRTTTLQVQRRKTPSMLHYYELICRLYLWRDFKRDAMPRIRLAKQPIIVRSRSLQGRRVPRPWEEPHSSQDAVIPRMSSYRLSVKLLLHK